MSTITVLDDEYVNLVYYPDKKIVHHTFHQTVQGEVFRNALNSGLEVFRKYDAHKWLSDDRKNSALPEDDTVWAKTIWFPQVLEAGWQYWALVWPAQTLAVLNLKEFIDEYRRFGLKTMVFKDTKPAMFWLEQNAVTPKTEPSTAP